MREVVSARYRARDGSEHAVIIERAQNSQWRIVDRGVDDDRLVDTLTGPDDRIAQAEALARDYAAEQAAFHSGRRFDDPLPRPTSGRAVTPWAA